jgi:hypothetical protein
MNSASVLPKQMRFPPKKGQKEKGFLIWPSGRKYILEVGSNLSGLKVRTKPVLGVNSTPLILIVFEKQFVLEPGAGG